MSKLGMTKISDSLSLSLFNDTFTIIHQIQAMLYHLWQAGGRIQSSSLSSEGKDRVHVVKIDPSPALSRGGRH